MALGLQCRPRRLFALNLAHLPHFELFVFKPQLCPRFYFKRLAARSLYSLDLRSKRAFLQFVLRISEGFLLSLQRFPELLLTAVVVKRFKHG